MLNAFLAIIGGLALLVWSANRFIDASAVIARHFGMPPLLIGMVIVGFGTSTPELLISALSSINGNPGIALGNAYGSNIVNIALILGISTLIQPLLVTKTVITRELPVLGGVTILAIVLLLDGVVSRLDALVMLAVFVLIMYQTIRIALKDKNTAAAIAAEAGIVNEEEVKQSPLKPLIWLLAGLGLMLLSSHFLVWGAVRVAEIFGVSDLVIGLTIVAVGTSLPELASSVIATRKGEHDLALGNILGSNTFNTLMVVGLAGVISPMTADPEVLRRDLPVMAFVTLLLYFFCRDNRLGRNKGIVLLLAYVTYTAYLFYGTINPVG